MARRLELAGLLDRSPSRERALCLAMMMEVHLIKVYGQGVADVSERLSNLTEA